MLDAGRYDAVVTNGCGTATSNDAALIVYVAADFDEDGDVDLNDFAHFQTCFNGPNQVPAKAGCADADADADNDVDLADFLTFHKCFNGPNRPPACL